MGATEEVIHFTVRHTLLPPSINTYNMACPGRSRFGAIFGSCHVAAS